MEKEQIDLGKIDGNVVHHVTIKDKSDLGKNIDDSERDYNLSQVLMKTRRKMANKIGSWWKTVRDNEKPSDEKNIVEQNREVACLQPAKNLPFDDRFLVWSAELRKSVLGFYLATSITSSLDFHFVLMILQSI